MKVTAAVLDQVGSEFTLKTLDLADPVRRGRRPRRPTAMLSVGLIEMQARGLSLKGIVESDSNPDVFIPRLIEMYQAGAFPFDKIITMIPFAKINDAVAAQARGEAVKVVLVHS